MLFLVIIFVFLSDEFQFSRCEINNDVSKDPPIWRKPYVCKIAKKAVVLPQNRYFLYVLPLILCLFILAVPKPSLLILSSIHHVYSQSENHTDLKQLVAIFRIMFCSFAIALGSGDGAVAKALASHQCGPGSISGDGTYVG